MKSDYEVLMEMLEKLKPEDQRLIDTSPVSGSTSVPNAKFINIRTNGFIFDEDGNLVDHWAEYD